MDDINLRIKKLRQDKGLSLSQFGESLGGVSKSYLSMLENDEKPITDSIADRIIKKHSINKQWLLFGKGDMIDTEKAAMKSVYDIIFQVIRRSYPQNCKQFRSFLLFTNLEDIDKIKSNWSKLSVLDHFPDITMAKWRESNIPPKEFIQTLIALYRDIENALKAWIKSVHILKDPAQGLAEFYEANENEKNLIDKIEVELIDCRLLVMNNRIILANNNDNNDLLEIGEIYKMYYKTLGYKENMEILDMIRGRMNKPPD